jgi:hypothetical protein
MNSQVYKQSNYEIRWVEIDQVKKIFSFYDSRLSEKCKNE